jgi:superfamily II DNA or RNA helicase
MGGVVTIDDDALRAARDRIARTILGDTEVVNPLLGEIRLRAHQVAAVTRLLEIIARHRGALLADAVGLGKTYVALAIARQHESALIICPAALRPMWERVTTATRVTVPVMSIEGLSRGDVPPVEPDLIVVDEAHHFRTPATRRYQAVASLARRARVLLLSATPLQNSRGDLLALLGLFAGSTVGQWTDDALARLIVRRDETTASLELPQLDGPHAISPGADDDCLDAILSLPPALPAADEGVAHALNTISLLHLWASSRAALIASVKKRRARAIAMREAIASGHVPTAAELRAWQFADDALQLAFAFPEKQETDLAGIAAHLDRYSDACEALVRQSAAATDPDRDRADMLRALQARHAGKRIVAFSQYAATVSALHRLLRTQPRVAAITAEGGRIASGGISRSQVLAQFAGGAPPGNPIERIDLLLTTDLLSEGVDLRGAAVIVHLDLPWNPARMEQRVGRARRLGSPHDSIHVYTFVPPVAADRMLELRRRLASKVRAARAMFGDIPAAFPDDNQCEQSSVAAAERARAVLTRWLDPAARRDDPEPIMAAAPSRCRGWIAAVVVDGLPRLLHSCGDSIMDDDASTLRVLESIGEAAPVDRGRADSALAQINRWLAARSAVAGSSEQSAPKRAVLHRLMETVARAPRHRRTAVLAAAQRARSNLSNVSGVGAERVLATLACSAAGDDAWIQSLETFGAIHALPRETRPDDQRVAAIILLS